jgi:hypothetical protein
VPGQGLGHTASIKYVNTLYHLSGAIAIPIRCGVKDPGQLHIAHQ